MGFTPSTWLGVDRRLWLESSRSRLHWSEPGQLTRSGRRRKLRDGPSNSSSNSKIRASLCTQPHLLIVSREGLARNLIRRERARVFACATYLYRNANGPGRGHPTAACHRNRLRAPLSRANSPETLETRPRREIHQLHSKCSGEARPVRWPIARPIGPGGQIFVRAGRTPEPVQTSSPSHFRLLRRSVRADTPPDAPREQSHGTPELFPDQLAFIVSPSPGNLGACAGAWQPAAA